MTELLRGVLPLLASHLQLTVVALVAGVVIALPLAVAAVRWPALRYPVTAMAGVVQTVPGLALLALMVPLLALTGGLFVGASSFGFAPAVIALTLYAVLPVLRNAIAGIVSVDPAAVEAARGMGMSAGQVLWQVQLPLSAPVIAAGIRTAAVWTVGAATLATPVGQRCLGNYIFAGLQTRNWPMVMVGVFASAGLASVLDLLLGGVERGISARQRTLALGSAAALVLVIGAGLVAPRLAIGPRAPSPLAAPGLAGAASARRAPVTRVRVGAKTFTEQYILVAALRRVLAAHGLEVDVVESLGSTVVFDALRQGDIDVYVGYSGTIWANHLKERGGGARWRVLSEVEAYLAREHGIRSLGSLGFEDAYGLAVRRDTAGRLGLRTVADLAAHAPGLRIGGDYEFFGRPEWAAVRDAYRLRFAATVSFDSTLMYEALVRGEVDVISAFTSDGRIAAHDLVVLDDPLAVLPPYDAMILLGPRVADDPTVPCALAALTGAIPVEDMRRANLMVDRDTDKATPEEAARWLLGRARLAPVRCGDARR
jgi:osmoprotectant transport system permease protein